METYSSVKIRDTVRFSWAKLFTNTEIHREISVSCGPHATLRPIYCEMVPVVGRRSNKLNRCEKARKTNNGQAVDMDFHMLDKIKEYLSGRHFTNHKKVLATILRWLQDQGAIF